MTRSALSDAIDRAEKAEAEVIRLRAALTREAQRKLTALVEWLKADEELQMARRVLWKPYCQIGNPGYVNDDGHEIQLHPPGGDRR